MIIESLSLSAGADFPLLAKAAITWTPMTFYIVATVIHTLLILIGFKLLHIDPEHNSFVGALLGAALGNAAVYLLGGFGLFGVIGAAAIYFGLLAAISSGEVLKSLIVFLVLMGIYAGMGNFLIPRTPLTAEKIGGLAQVVISGNLEAEPITEDDAEDLSKPREQ